MRNRNKLHCKLFSVCQGISNVRFWHKADIRLNKRGRRRDASSSGNNFLAVTGQHFSHPQGVRAKCTQYVECELSATSAPKRYFYHSYRAYIEANRHTIPHNINMFDLLLKSIIRLRGASLTKASQKVSDAIQSRSHGREHERLAARVRWAHSNMTIFSGESRFFTSRLHLIWMIIITLHQSFTV